MAFLLTETQDRLFADPNFAVLLQGAAGALDEHDIPLVLLLAGTDSEKRRATEFITAGHVDGVLLVSSHASHSSFLKQLVNAEIPAIAAGVPLGFERAIGSVSADDRSGAERAVEYLREQGRTRIATIAGPQDTSGGSERLAGYRAALAEGTGELIAVGDYSRDSGARGMAELLERDARIDAVFVASDLMAAGAIDTMRDRGIRVPDDVAVVGFDDSPIALATRPALTTMRQPLQRISREMVRLLLDAIAGQSTATLTMATELVVRDSA